MAQVEGRNVRKYTLFSIVLAIHFALNILLKFVSITPKIQVFHVFC